MVKQTVATFGRLDTTYNNAGVQNVLAETVDTNREYYDRVMGNFADAEKILQWSNQCK